MVWCGVVWCDGCGVVWRDMMGCGVVWCGVVWSDQRYQTCFFTFLSISTPFIPPFSSSSIPPFHLCFHPHHSIIIFSFLSQLTFSPLPHSSNNLLIHHSFIHSSLPPTWGCSYRPPRPSPHCRNFCGHTPRTRWSHAQADEWMHAWINGCMRG